MASEVKIVSTLRSRLLLLGALAALPFLLWSCGDSDPSAEQAKLEQARREGATAAHRADQIRQLQREVAAMKKRDRAGSAERPSSQSQPEVAVEGADSRIPVSGSYSGEGRQRGTPGALNKDYPIQMIFSSTGSHVAYPTLDCEGLLRPLGFEGSSRVYEEQITSGHCDSGGTWLVHVDDPTTLEAVWSLSSATYTVTAVLGS